MKIKHEVPVVSILHLTLIFPLIYAVIFPQKLGSYKNTPRYILTTLVTIAVIYHVYVVAAHAYYCYVLDELNL